MTRARTRPGRGARPGRGLSLDRIVSATLELVDEQGIGAASMRAVASRLGVRSMSLYRYVEDRDELLDAVVERIVNELGDDPRSGAPGRRLAPVPDRDGAWGTPLRPRAPARLPAGCHPTTEAPSVDPPLRSLRWVESMLGGLAGEGFTDEQVLFTYRTFNSFLLGYLLLETSAMALQDPKPGDGSFPAPTPAWTGRRDGWAGHRQPGARRAEPARSPAQREAVEDADSPHELIDPADEIDRRRFPTVSRLAAGLARTAGNKSSGQAWRTCSTALRPSWPGT